MKDTCVNCSGYLTRSIHLSDQPSTSDLCAACWYNEHHTLSLITLDELDDLIDATPESHTDLLIKAVQGVWVDWHGDIGIFTQTDGNLRIAVWFTCARCEQHPTQFYMGSGLHSGAWPYAYDDEGNLLGNIRDQEFRCSDCQKETV